MPCIVESGRVGPTPDDASEGQLAFGPPLATPSFQQLRAQLMFACKLALVVDPAFNARITAIFKARL
jgi:hypothetical protein